ncbi:hypothetical protein PS833_04154 [Pseudomonas fluorescens]|uniref:Transposase IS200-like domain-containing protein n=1 Tax=Pseudomonas fluorescens TaxID=294 RepID=A0A5E7DS94_PSEFL|nr:hypothetical protein PS833_04154 [Pseudomonas fluorescens]
MPRTGRVVLPNYPHHVVQRGHNRQVVFADTDDFKRYLSDLRELKEAFGVKIYAYCLMTNHVHLLLAPGDIPSALGQLMKTLAARMTRYRNKLEGRSGTLWESRYKSSVVQSDTYLLACSRYIELNPVRARIALRAEDYPWSSYRLRLLEPSGPKTGTDLLTKTGTDLLRTRRGIIKKNKRQIYLQQTTSEITRLNYASLFTTRT